MADRLGDVNLRGSALLAVAVHHWCYGEVRESADAGLRGGELLRQTGNLWDFASGSNFVGTSLLALGRIDESVKLWSESGPLASRLGHRPASGVDFQVALLREGDIDAAEAYGRDALERLRSGEDDGTTWVALAFLGAAHFLRGHWQDALAVFDEVTKVQPTGALAGHGEAFTVLVRAYMGDREKVHALLQTKGVALPRRSAGAPASSPLLMVRAARASGLGVKGLLGILLESRAMKNRGPLPRAGHPNPLGSWSTLFVAVEALAVLGEKSEAAKLYPLLQEAMQMGVVIRGWDMRLLETLAGIAAGAGQDWPKAEEHFQTALRRAEELPDLIEQPEARRFYARMLLDRNGPGDRETARGLLTEAIEMYRRIGMPKHLELTEKLLGEATAAQ